jgi:K+-sensing histidine kinase KdpD
MAATPNHPQRPWVIAASGLAPLLICAVLSRFRESVAPTIACLLLVLIVVGAAATGDRVGGFVAAFSGGTWFNFFLTEPYNSFVIGDRGNIVVAVLLVLIGAGVTELSLWGRRHQAQASARAGYLEGVLGAAELISVHHQSSETLAANVAQRIADVLDVSTCRFVANGMPDPRNAILQRDGTITHLGHPINVERHGLPTLEETLVLVRRGETTLGYFIFFSADKIAYPSVEQRKVAVLLADQMGAALGTDIM